MQTKREWPTVRVAGEKFVILIILSAIGLAVWLYYEAFMSSPPMISSLASFFGYSILVVIASFFLLMTGCRQEGAHRASQIKISPRLMRPFLALVGGCLVLSIVFGILGW